MTPIVAVDIGGTHARFALAEVHGGKLVSIGAETVLKVGEHVSFESAWNAYAAVVKHTLPAAAALAVAGPADGPMVKLANNPWTIQPRLLPQLLGLDHLTLINDFAAIGHAVAQLPDADFKHLCGPEISLSRAGIISILGPGTGLGVAQLFRYGAAYHVIATEGGHADYAPVDDVEDMILKRLRKRFGRVSAERMVAGPAMADIYAILAGLEERRDLVPDDKSLWQSALAGTDSVAVAALHRFGLALGSVAGDIALTHGAVGVVIAGGLGLRLADYLPPSGFGQRFAAKGRFEAMMAALPVKLLTYPQPGLYGVAAAFAGQHPHL